MQLKMLTLEKKKHIPNGEQETPVYIIGAGV